MLPLLRPPYALVLDIRGDRALDVPAARLETRARRVRVAPHHVAHLRESQRERVGERESERESQRERVRGSQRESVRESQRERVRERESERVRESEPHRVRHRDREIVKGRDWGVGEHPSYLALSVLKVVSQKSIPTRIHQLILYTSNTRSPRDTRPPCPRRTPSCRTSAPTVRRGKSSDGPPPCSHLRSKNQHPCSQPRGSCARVSTESRDEG